MSEQDQQQVAEIFEKWCEVNHLYLNNPPNPKDKSHQVQLKHEIGGSYLLYVVKNGGGLKVNIWNLNTDNESWQSECEIGDLESTLDEAKVAFESYKPRFH